MLLKDAGVETNVIGTLVEAALCKVPYVVDNDIRPNKKANAEEMVVAGDWPGRSHESGVL